MSIELLVTETEVIEVIEQGPAGIQGAPGANIGAPVGSELVAYAASFFDQLPITPDVPLKVNFGATGSSFNPNVTILSNGDVVINNAGYYTIDLQQTLGKASNSGYAKLVTFGSVDVGSGPDNSVVPSVVYEFDRVTRVSNQFQNNGFFPAGAIVNAWIVRQSDGTNDGGLYSGELTEDLVTLGLNPIASAVMSVYKWEVR